VVPLQAQNAKTSNVKDYLKKLLLKAFSSTLSSKASPGLEASEMEIAFHFASNKRFFTCSRPLLKRPRPIGRLVALRLLALRSGASRS